MKELLQSETTGKVFLIFLRIGLVLSGFGLLLTIPYVYFFDFYLDYLSGIDRFFEIFNYISYLIQAVIFLIWIVHVHRDLRRLIPSYPVSPSGAVVRLAVPVVNLWGIASTFYNMAVHFQKALTVTEATGSEKATDGEKLSDRLMHAIPFLYLALFATQIIDRILRKIEVNEVWFLVYYVAELYQQFVFIVMTVTIIRLLHRLHTRATHEQEKEQEIAAEV